MNERMSELVQKINQCLRTKRKAYVRVDDDDLAENLQNYYREQHFKVRVVDNWGRFYIAKRWWW